MGLGKPTEMTLGNLLIDELRSRGIVVVAEFFCFTVFSMVGIIHIAKKSGARCVLQKGCERSD